MSETPSGASLKVSAWGARDSASGRLENTYGVTGAKTDPLWDWTVGLLGLGQLDLSSEGLVGLANSLVYCLRVYHRGATYWHGCGRWVVDVNSKSFAAMELSISEPGSRAQG